LLGGIHQLEVDTRGLQRNQQTNSRSVDRINPCEIENESPLMLLNGCTQYGSLLTAHNSPRTPEIYHVT